MTDPDTPRSARGIEVRKQSVRHDGDRLANLVKLVDAGELSLRVARTFPLADAARAHRLRDKGGVRGRIVLVP